MGDWIDNTVSTILIIIVSAFVLVGCMGLLALSMCASGGFGESRPEQGTPFALGAILLFFGGIAIVSWLARHLFQSSQVAEPAQTDLPISKPVEVTPHTIPDSEEGWLWAEVTSEPAPAPLPGPVPVPAEITFPPKPIPNSAPLPSITLHLSPQASKAVHRLVQVLAVQIVLSGCLWIFNQLHFWAAPSTLAPHHWILMLLAPYILHQLPYAILIFLLLKRPSQIAFRYAVAVPAVLSLQSLLGLSVLAAYYIRHPLGVLLLLLPWCLHIVILVLAYKALQRAGLHPKPSALMFAATASFFYFLIVQSITVFFYRAHLA